MAMLEHDYEPTHRLVRRAQGPKGPLPEVTLLDHIIPPVPPPSDDRIDKRFARFHAEHPEVYVELVRLARRAKAAGETRVGIKMLWEIVRFEGIVAKDPDRRYALNNVMTSRYARLIMASEADLAGLFETRKLLSKT